MQNTNIVFWGSSKFSVIVLEELKKSKIIPSAIVTLPDKPKGRKLILTPTPVKVWALENKIPIEAPLKLDSAFEEKIKGNLFIVASYGKIIPEKILNIPKYGCLNVHPSMLPKYRGASPLQNMILNDEKEVGVTIILMDKEMDHGPIISKSKIEISNWPVSYNELENILGQTGGKMLSEVIPLWTQGKINAIEQDHTKATFTKKIEKEEGFIDEKLDSKNKFLKYLALKDTVGVYFETQKNGKKIKVKITNASLNDGVFQINKVIPQNQKEVKYSDFENSLKSKK